MNKLTTAIITGFYSLSTVFGLMAMMPATVRAHDDTEKTAKTSSAASKEIVYNYVAQTGDSYSKIARKAIQTYGIRNKVKMSHAKIIAAETWLTQEAGSPSIQAGQKIHVHEKEVKVVVDKAVKLSAAKEKAWAAYTAGVNFNTNAVGQAK